MNPESLRAYARVGPAGFISWTRAAESAVVDAKQTSNFPRVDNCEGMVAVRMDLGQPISARAQAVLDAADTESHLAADSTPLPAPVPLPPPPPLPHDIACVGRRVLVPRCLWPSYPCTEHGGDGWEGRITSFSSRGVVVAFAHASTAKGLSYEPVRLQLAALTPL